MVKVSDWDASEYLSSEEDMIEYLNVCLESEDPQLIQSALGDIAKARGMSQIAQQAHVGRESLYKSLSSSGNPSFQTIVKVIRALGGKLTIQPSSSH